MTYRLNYGNGQVSGHLDTLAEVRKAESDQRRYSKAIGQSVYGLHIERYIGYGEWERVRPKDDPPWRRGT